jgi:hypothetical protein
MNLGKIVGESSSDLMAVDPSKAVVINNDLELMFESPSGKHELLNFVHRKPRNKKTTKKKKSKKINKKVSINNN